MRSSLTRRLGVTIFGATAILVAVASAAWACTAGAIAYLFVVPPAAPETVIDLSPDARGLPIYAFGACVEGCTGRTTGATATEGNLWMSNSTVGTYAVPPVRDPLPTSLLLEAGPNPNCAKDKVHDIGDVITTPEVGTVGTAATVTEPGTAFIPKTKAKGTYVVCADPYPGHIWNYFTVV
jgi:hypothetical protein